MDLEKVAAEIRPRQAYEAIDLGVDLGRLFWRRLWSSWFACVIPAWLLILGGGLALGAPLWTLLLAIWWLKPLWDRVPLFVLSRSLFGAPPRVGVVVRELPRMWWRGLFWALTSQRLDPRRAFSLPVWELEGLKGKPRRKRLEVLRVGQESSSLALTLACATFEQILSVGMLIGVFMFVPEEWGASGDALLNTLFEVEEVVPWWSHALTTSAWLLAVTLVEPLYVAGGFGLYLNRRIVLEGWDIQLAFERLAARLEAGEQGGGRKLRAGAALALAAVLLGSPSPGFAQQPAPQVERDPERVIDEVLADPVFGYDEQQTSWRRRAGSQAPSAPNVDLPDLGVGDVPWWQTGWVAYLPHLAWVVGGGLLLWGLVLVLRQRWSFGWGRKQRVAPARPEVILGLDVRPESLPADVPGEASALWLAGRQVEALSLLYRGALARLVQAYPRLGIDESATEGDCLAAVRRVDGPEAYFADLTRGWQQAAYAAQPPREDDFRGLCAGWGETFGERSRSGS